MVLPMTLHVPEPTGTVRVQLITPMTSTPAGKVSVRLVSTEEPGPLLVTPTVHVNGWLSVAVPRLAVLVTARSTRWRTVVSSVVLSLAGKVSGSLALTLTTF